MLKFMVAGNKEKPTMVGLGIEQENVNRLQQGQPILVDMAQFGYRGLQVVIFYGRTMGDLYAQVEAGIGPDTAVHGAADEG